jgi:hypothetical protein
MEQLASAARVAPQALAPVVTVKSVGLPPPMAMLLIFSVALPEFESVAASADEVVPTTVLVNESGGERVATGAVATMKFAVTLWGALMVTVVEALLALATLPVQLANLKPDSGVAVRFTTAPDV